jgi:hypothetical protein
MFHPFREGVAAKLLQMNTTIDPFYRSASSMLQYVDRKVELARQQSSLGANGPFLTQSVQLSWKEAVQDIIRNDLEEVGKNYLWKMKTSVMFV